MITLEQAKELMEENEKLKKHVIVLRQTLGVLAVAAQSLAGDGYDWALEQAQKRGSDD